MIVGLCCCNKVLPRHYSRVEVLDFGCWNGVVEIKSYPGTCRVGKLIIVGSWNCVVEKKSYPGTCRVEVDNHWKFELFC